MFDHDDHKDYYKEGRSTHQHGSENSDPDIGGNNAIEGQYGNEDEHGGNGMDGESYRHRFGSDKLEKQRENTERWDARELPRNGEQEGKRKYADRGGLRHEERSSREHYDEMNGHNYQRHSDPHEKNGHSEQQDNAMAGSEKTNEIRSSRVIGRVASLDGQKDASKGANDRERMENNSLAFPHSESASLVATESGSSHGDAHGSGTLKDELAHDSLSASHGFRSRESPGSTLNSKQADLGDSISGVSDISGEGSQAVRDSDGDREDHAEIVESIAFRQHKFTENLSEYVRRLELTGISAAEAAVRVQIQTSLAELALRAISHLEEISDYLKSTDSMIRLTLSRLTEVATMDADLVFPNNIANSTMPQERVLLQNVDSYSASKSRSNGGSDAYSSSRRDSDHSKSGTRSDDSFSFANRNSFNPSSGDASKSRSTSNTRPRKFKSHVSTTHVKSTKVNVSIDFKNLLEGINSLKNSRSDRNRTDLEETSRGHENHQSATADHQQHSESTYTPPQTYYHQTLVHPCSLCAQNAASQAYSSHYAANMQPAYSYGYSHR